MGETEEERSILEDLDVKKIEQEPSILGELNHIRDHIATLEAAALAARAVEFDQIRGVVRQLEMVAEAAKAVEHDLAQELAETKRISVGTARVVRERLAVALLALADALGAAERKV